MASVRCSASDDPAEAPSMSSSPSPPPSTPPPVEPTDQTIAREPDLVIGPDGAGPLRLGMTVQEVRATGVAQTYKGSAHDGWRPGCWIVDYRSVHLGRVPGDTLNGQLAVGRGVEVLYATRRMATPEGIRIGSTVAEVELAYDRKDLEPTQRVLVRASPRTLYRIQLDGVRRARTGPRTPAPRPLRSRPGPGGRTRRTGPRRCCRTARRSGRAA